MPLSVIKSKASAIGWSKVSRVRAATDRKYAFSIALQKFLHKTLSDLEALNFILISSGSVSLVNISTLGSLFEATLMKLTNLVMTLMIAAAANGALTACSDPTQTQAPHTTPTSAAQMQGMDHDGMDHSMAMDLGPADANYDLRFIDAMRLHHRGAIAMAKEAQQKSQRPEIKQLAKNIIAAQSREENQLLRQWRQAWYPQASEAPITYGGNSNTIPMSEQQSQSMTMAQELGAADAEFDLRFMNAMTAHHEGAITMAEDALKKSKRPEIKQLAQEIISSQQKEIDQMKQWRQTWYKQ